MVLRHEAILSWGIYCPSSVRVSKRLMQYSYMTNKPEFEIIDNKLVIELFLHPWFCDAALN